MEVNQRSTKPMSNPISDATVPSAPVPSDPDHQSSVDSETSSKLQVDRLGNTGQCPICGSDVHEDAYHCTKCRSFFCYHCRAHLSGDDPILQCGNRDCGYYGKWVCGVCDPLTKKQETPLEYIEPVDGYWPAWLIASILGSVLTGWYLGWKSALIVLIGMYAGVGYLLQSMEVNIFGKQRKVSMDRTTDVHSCICCERPTKKTGLRQRAG